MGCGHDEGWELYDAAQEYHRMGIAADGPWRVSTWEVALKLLSR